MDHDLLDSLLDLEEGFYKEGYDLGVSDGARAGYSEGSVFAVEKGFEKFQEMGRLYGKAIIWAKRLPGDHGLLLHPAEAESSPSSSSSKQQAPGNKEHAGVEKATEVKSLTTGNSKLPALPANSRLEKHIATLLSLVDPLTLSTENSEEAVADFDDRLKKATAKAKIIEKIIGEHSGTPNNNNKKEANGGGGPGTGNIEDIGPLPPRMQMA
ncbi:hypothetical protein FQN50_005985 [Emmonsiellopsis sp. PD_5]|nr:hypothetical protein FQN50_005985 [Emmonsiellopsis sp. PD_5]